VNAWTVHGRARVLVKASGELVKGFALDQENEKRGAIGTGFKPSLALPDNRRPPEPR
jgi:hypothetical protein